MSDTIDLPVSHADGFELQLVEIAKNAVLWPQGGTAFPTFHANSYGVVSAPQALYAWSPAGELLAVTQTGNDVQLIPLTAPELKPKQLVTVPPEQLFPQHFNITTAEMLDQARVQRLEVTGLKFPTSDTLEVSQKGVFSGPSLENHSRGEWYEFTTNIVYSLDPTKGPRILSQTAEVTPLPEYDFPRP